MAMVRVQQPLDVDGYVVRELTDDECTEYAARSDGTQQGEYPLGIFQAEQLIGGIAMHDRNEPDDVELGYWLDPSWQGRGIATAVVKAVTAELFRHRTVQRVLIQHRPDNLRSQRIPERLGFRRIAHRATCTCGHADHVVWAISRDEWLPCT